MSDAAYTIEMALAAMARARDVKTADAIYDLNRKRFPLTKATNDLWSAYIQRVAELRNTDASLEADAWKSVELGAKLQKRPYNPDSRNARQMPEMLRKHGVVEALSRTINKRDDEGTSFFQRCVTAGNLAYTSEAICLRHPDHFDEATKETARQRLARYPSLPR